jgi:SRSO17 transposase
MTTDDLRAAAGQLVHLHERFAPLFGRKEARQQSRVYLNGLLLAAGRKNAEAMALEYGTPTTDGISQLQVLGLQRFLTYSPWDYQDIQREIQRVFAEELMPSAAAWSIGTVGVFDSSGFPKKGDDSVGVARQYCGRLGKTDNCQVGVFLAGVTPAGSALLDHQLYLPKHWAKDKKRRAKTHVPTDVRFRTELQIATELLRRTTAPGMIRFDWVCGDDTYGRNGGFLDDLEAAEQRYLLDVPPTTTVWCVDPATQIPPPQGRGRPPSRPSREEVCSVQELAARLPAAAWQALQVREGACNPLVFEFAALRVWAVRHRRPGPAIWVVMRRSVDDRGAVKYGVSNAAADTPLETLALVTGCRFRVDEWFEDGKMHLGMSQYEARAWSSWHHHMSLVGLAHLFVTLTKARLKKKTPELTLDMSVRLLRSVLQRPKLTEEEAIAVMDYHLERNRIARRSYQRSWKKRHEKLEFKLLL